MQKVLIIDDDPAIAQLTKTSLQSGNFKVEVAANGTSGIEMAVQVKPDFILLDEILPDMSGADVLRVIKKEPSTAAIPVAIFSDYKNEALMQDAQKSGALGYIIKYEQDIPSLPQKISSYLNPSSSSDQVNKT